MGNVWGVREPRFKVSRAADERNTGETTMKQFLTVGALAALAVLATSRTADAWCNSKFSVGLNWSLQSGNNNLLWGVYRNGQIPDGYDGGGYGGPGAPPPGYGAQPFPWFGSAQQQSNMPQASVAMPNVPQGGYAYNGYGYNGYGAGGYNSNLYPANYQYQTGYQPYYAPGYYAPSYYPPAYYPGHSDPFQWYYQR
jgi:hypothetical protein